MRDPVREYGLEATPGVARPEVDALNDGLFGVTPRGGPPPLTLCERPFELELGARLDCFLSGDSGLGRDGRLGLNIGLAGLAPGPTDCENLAGKAGVGGV
jgi:hypothetical protein